MSKSIYITFLIALLTMANLEQTLGLAGVVNRVRNNSIWGKSRKASKCRQSNSLLPVQGIMSNQVAAEQMSPSSPSTMPPTVESAAFDADLYRREMTDLVYQRNMQRMFEN